MKLTMLRRAASGPRSSWLLGGAAAGLALVAGTIGAATLRARSPGTVADLLAVVFAVWALGWVLGRWRTPWRAGTACRAVPAAADPAAQVGTRPARRGIRRGDRPGHLRRVHRPGRFRDPARHGPGPHRRARRRAATHPGRAAVPGDRLVVRRAVPVPRWRRGQRPAQRRHAGGQFLRLDRSRGPAPPGGHRIPGRVLRRRARAAVQLGGARGRGLVAVGLADDRGTAARAHRGAAAVVADVGTVARPGAVAPAGGPRQPGRARGAAALDARRGHRSGIRQGAAHLAARPAAADQPGRPARLRRDDLPGAWPRSARRHSCRSPARSPP